MSTAGSFSLEFLEKLSCKNLIVYLKPSLFALQSIVKRFLNQ